MKTHARFIIVTILSALVATAHAVAGDSSWPVIDNHHGSYTYLWRPKQTETTIAFGGNAKTSSTPTKSKPATVSPAKDKWYFHEITTSHGVVSYYESAE